MNEDRLRSLLREAPVPVGEDAERRGLAVASEAFAQRRRGERPVLPRLALALAIATLLAALLLSPAGAAVRDWVGDAFTAGAPNAAPGLTEIPAGGRLLVETPAGPWVVQPDGSRRLLGEYREATWSPHGLFVGVASGHTLSAIEPDGTPRWSLSAKGAVWDPRWSPSGFEIAYRAGGGLWVVGADGNGDTLLDPQVAAVPPAWSSRGLAMLAYVNADGELHVANTETAESIGSARALAGISSLEWAADGSTLLEASLTTLRLRDLDPRKLLGRLSVEPARHISLPADATIESAAFSPDGRTIVALLRSAGDRAPGPHSEVVLIDTEDGSRRGLFAVTGRLSGLAWSPDGSRLLTSWPDADEWLFLPRDRRRPIRAIDGVAGEFSPGRRSPSFPSIVGWCCRRDIADPAD